MKDKTTIHIVFDGKYNDLVSKKDRFIEDMSKYLICVNNIGVFKTDSKEEMSMYLSLHGYKIGQCIFDPFGICRDYTYSGEETYIIARIHRLEMN